MPYWDANWLAACCSMRETRASTVSVFRRYVAPDGTLGPEERLTLTEDGNVNKPNPVRLDPCRVAVTVSLVSDPNPTAWRARSGFMMLTEDAARP